MLTRRGRVTLVLCITLLVVGRVLGVTELFGVAAVAGFLVVAALVQSRAGAVSVTLSGQVNPDAVVAGSPAVLELRATNEGAAPTPANRLQLLPSGGGSHRVLVPRLAPNERAVVTIGLDTRTRGPKTVRGYEAFVVDAMGLAQRRLTSSRTFPYLVRPSTEILPRILPLGAGGGGLESTRSAAERLRSGASLLRQYVEGDDLRLVHWRTTARVGDLMVREGGEPDLSGRSGATIVLVTRSDPGPAFERAVEVAASILRVAETLGPFRLRTTSGYDSGMSTGPLHLETTMVTLATVETVSASGGPGRHGRRPSGQERPAALGAEPFSGPDDWNVTVAVEAIRDLDDLDRRREELLTAPARSGSVLLVLVGSPDLRFERVTRDCSIVLLPVSARLGDVWNASVEVPVGETRSVVPA